MELFNLSDYDLKTKILWYLTLFLSLIALCFAVFKAIEFSVLQFAVLGISLFISLLVNKYQIKIPKTQTTISAKELAVFWGTIWLGIPGGILLAASASLARFGKIPGSQKRWLFGFYVNTFSTLISASVLYLTLYYFAGFTPNTVDDNTVSVKWLFIAVSLMAITHFWLFAIFTSVFLTWERNYSFLGLWKKNFLWTAVSYLIGTIAVFLLHLIFLTFGLGFGFIVLPMVVFAHIAYKIHLAELAVKTKEISESSRIHLATVEALATAIDARDQVGIGQVRRTQIYAVGIGKILGLSTSDIQALNTGALLHDIGKLAVPDHILNKPGKLTFAEMEKIKIHASVSALILEKIDFPYPVIPTIKYHHEKYDGSGYPEGLKGNNIPLTARILSVADAYDTLRSARPYRAAVSREEARRFLTSGTGTQFDPKIVDVFLRNLRQFEKEIQSQGFSYIVEGTTGERNNSMDFEKNQSYVEQIKRANREIFSLYELARVFSSSLNLYETLSLFVEKIGELVPFDTCAVYLMNETEEFATVIYAAGKNNAALKDKMIKPGEGATGYVLKKRLPVYNINPGLDFSFQQLDFIQDYTAMASLPLISDEKMVGAVSIYACEIENYQEEHMRLLETVSRIAADAICMALQHAESESRALTDPMTNLPNARSLQIHFEKEAGRASRNGSNFQLLMLDLDGFKAVNDTFGHKVGDAMLREISKVMRGQLRDYDFLARYAGDEFVAIVPETDSEEIREFSQRLEKAVSDYKLPISDGEFARVGVSLGAACYPRDGETLDQIIIAADKAMYSAKAFRKRSAKAKLPPLQIEQIIEVIEEITNENLIVELDESHIISNAVN